MTLATVRAVATRFLKDPRPGVLVIKGDWGVGKTFAWNQLLKEVSTGCARESYAYVSLFGIASISELRSAIFAKTQAIESLDEPFDLRKVGNQWTAWRGKGAEWLQKLRDVGYVKYVSIGIDALTPFLVRNLIICLDDFERLNDAHIPADQLLGYVSELREERNCKIVLIFNETKLDNKKEDYRKYREKVVDLELMFDPSPDEAAELGISLDVPNRERVIELATSLQIRNIRVLRKISELLKMLHAEVRHLDGLVIDQVIQTTVLFSWSYYESGANRPPFEFLKNWNALAFEIREEAKKEKQDEGAAKRREWSDLLERYRKLPRQADTSEVEILACC